MLYKCFKCEQMSNFSLGTVFAVHDELSTVVECQYCNSPTVISITIQKPPNQDYKDKDWLEIEYTVNRRTMSQIADMCGVSAMTIYQWLKRHEIETRKRGQKRL